MGRSKEEGDIEGASATFINLALCSSVLNKLNSYILNHILYPLLVLVFLLCFFFHTSCSVTVEQRLHMRHTGIGPSCLNIFKCIQLYAGTYVPICCSPHCLATYPLTPRPIYSFILWHWSLQSMV